MRRRTHERAEGLRSGCTLTAVEPGERFYADIRDAIDAHGGTATIYDTMDPELARKG